MEFRYMRLALNAHLQNLRLAALLLILCVIAAYVPAIGNGYVWDDDTLLTANPQVRSPHGLVEIWQGKNSRDFTPLTITGFRLEWKLWGGVPTGYHVVNVLLHALSAVLLWRILKTMRIPGAWLAALLFGIHPVNVASVAWIAERKNTLSTALFLGSLLCFLRSHKKRNAALYAASVFLFVLAGLSKGAVVVLPAVLLVCVLWMERKITRRDLLRIAPLGLIALTIAWLTVRYQMRGEDYGLVPDGIPFRISRTGFAFWHYLGGIFLPVGKSPFCAPWNPNLHSLSAWLPSLAALVLFVRFFLERKSLRRPLIFAYGCYVLILLPVLGFVRMLLQQETPCADWWQYLATPCIFACVGAGYSIAIAESAKGVRPVLIVLMSVMIALLFAQTWRRCAIYESMETYCRAVLAENPHAWSMQNNLGVVLKKHGELADAVACYRKALEDNPRFMEAHNNLGNALGMLGDLPGAEAEFVAALRLHPANPEILANLAGIYFGEGKIRDAFATQSEAIKADRYNPAQYEAFGKMLAGNKQYEPAVTCYGNALLLSPENVRVQIALISALRALGRHDEAAKVCAEAIESAKKSGNSALVEAVETLARQTDSKPSAQ